MLRQFPVDQFLFTGQGLNSTKTFSRVRQLLHARQTPCRLVWDGVELSGEPGVLLAFLHPPRGWFRSVPRTQMLDENSAVLKIVYQDTAALLPADIKARAERRVQGRLGDLPPERLLQVPHHGSLYGSTYGFLVALRPRHAIVSAGADNRFGHPHPAVVIRYRDHGTSLWQTAQTGAIRARSDGRRWSIQRADR